VCDGHNWIIGHELERSWHMKIFALSMLSLMAGCAANTQPQTAPPAMQGRAPLSADKGSQLSDYLTARAEEGFSGVVLVNVDGKTILHEAYDPFGHAINRDSCFWIASVSKMFTAATAVLLHEQGKLDLQVPISAYLDSVPADKRNITLHQLLTHTSGLGSSYVAEGIVDRAEATRAILAAPLNRPVGRSYLYSGDGYNLAAIIIESIAGMPFEDVVRSRILSPMKLTRTGFWGNPADEASCAIVPFATDANLSNSLSGPHYGFRGATGMSSSARDLLRWYQALFDNAQISDDVRKLVFTPYVEKRPGVSYGYGWNIVETPRGTRMLAHSGQDDLITHVSYLYAFPDEDVVLILLTDSGTNIGNETLIGMRNILFPKQQ